jgi:hypothetical protein
MGGCRTRLQRYQTQSSNLGSLKRDAHSIHLVLIRIVARRIETLLRPPHPQRLDRKRAARTQQVKRATPVTLSWGAIPGRSDEHIPAKPGDVGDNNSPSPAGDRVP